MKSQLAAKVWALLWRHFNCVFHKSTHKSRIQVNINKLLFSWWHCHLTWEGNEAMVRSCLIISQPSALFICTYFRSVYILICTVSIVYRIPGLLYVQSFDLGPPAPFSQKQVFGGATLACWNGFGGPNINGSWMTCESEDRVKALATQWNRIETNIILLVFSCSYCWSFLLGEL